MIVELHEGAAEDLQAAIGWYESKAPRAGYELEAEVDATMDRIAELPLAWPPATGTGRTASRGRVLRRSGGSGAIAFDLHV